MAERHDLSVLDTEGHANPLAAERPAVRGCIGVALRVGRAGAGCEDEAGNCRAERPRAVGKAFFSATSN
jgi:hypothetical protein